MPSFTRPLLRRLKWFAHPDVILPTVYMCILGNFYIQGQRINRETHMIWDNLGGQVMCINCEKQWEEATELWNRTLPDEDKGAIMKVVEEWQRRENERLLKEGGGKEDGVRHVFGRRLRYPGTIVVFPAVRRKDDTDTASQ